MKVSVVEVQEFDKRMAAAFIGSPHILQSVLTAPAARATFAPMDTDEIAPPPRAGDPLALAVKMDLDPLSVSELVARVAMLEKEIVRTRAQIEQATRHRSIADELFKR